MKTQTILVLAATLGLGIFGVFPQEAVAVVSFNDGQIHNINYYIDDNVDVDQGMPGVQTTVNLLAGGALQYEIIGCGDSRVNILGGWMGWYLAARENSVVNVSGGSIGTYLVATGSSLVRISGGTIGEGLFASYNGQVEITGGRINWYLLARHSGRITLYGSDFAINGQPFGYGELSTVYGGNWYDEPTRYLIGTLASGELFANNFIIAEDAKIVLAPIPAPGALVLGSIGIVIVGWLRRMDIRKQMR